MSIQDCATAAVNVFSATMNEDEMVEMVAIAGVESSWENNSAGDYGYGGPHCGDGSTSWGLWQIHNVHSDVLEQLTGSSSPCVWRDWLYDPNNNALAALAVFKQAMQCFGWGFQPWKPDITSGKYKQFMDHAQAAVTAALQQNCQTGYYWDGSECAPIIPPVSTVSLPPLWLLAIGGALLAAGAGYLAWQSGMFKPQAVPAHGFAHHKPDRKDHRVNPKWRLFTRPTEADIGEISDPPLNPCTIVANTKLEMEKRGVQYVEDRNLPDGVEAYYTRDKGKDKIYISSSIYSQARECMPYGAGTYLHEDAHVLVHNPGCLPRIRGVSYESAGHQVEETEAELSSYAAMVELKQPVELYDGTVIPPGTEQIDWDIAQKYLDPDTYNNVRYATDWLVRAARGQDGDLTTSVCPALIKGGGRYEKKVRTVTNYRGYKIREDNSDPFFDSYTIIGPDGTRLACESMRECKGIIDGMIGGSE